MANGMLIVSTANRGWRAALYQLLQIPDDHWEVEFSTPVLHRAAKCCIVSLAGLPPSRAEPCTAWSAGILAGAIRFFLASADRRGGERC
jgi:hypothetical protein